MRRTLRSLYIPVAAAGLFAVGCGEVKGTIDGAVADAPKDAFVAPAALTISPLTSDFGSVIIGQTSTATTFTVTNTGASMSDQVVVAFTGTTTDFHLASNTCQALAPAATCTIGVTFGPTVPGARPAMLTAHVAGSTASASITGTGNLPGNLGVTPSTYAFADMIVGATTTEVDTITVRNTGTLTSGTLSVQATGSNPGEFTKTTDTCSGQTLAASATCTLGITFTPTTSGPKSAGFAVIGNPGGTTISVITGNAIAPAQLAVAPATLDFGSVVQGATSTNATIQVANIGGATTGAVTTALTGPDAASFTIATSNCTGALAALASCTMVLRYTPSNLGTQSATLTISGTPGGTVTTALSGTGVISGQLTITPTTQAFATTQVGQTTAATTFTVTNTAGTSAGPLNVQFTGANSGDFHFGGSGTTCVNATLAAGGTCVVTVVFAPTSVGAKTATLSVTNGGSISASLSGIGVPPPQLAISPASKDFGSVGLGSTSSVQAFTVTNVGGAAATVPTVTLGGTNPGEFLQNNDCTAALAPLATCTVSVQFKPTTSAFDSASLTVAAATGGTVTASLFGQGQPPAQLAVLPSSLSFIGTVGDTSAVQTFLVRNDGTVTTGPITIATGGGVVTSFAQTNTCTTLAAGATCTVSVTFVPANPGVQNGTATVSATPGGTASVALSGNARPRLEVVSINGAAPIDPINFGTQFLGTTSTASIKLQNNTAAAVTVSTQASFPTPTQFAVNAAGCTSIAAGGTCLVSASFTPTSIGLKAGSIAFTIGNGPSNLTTVNLAGTGASSIVVTANTAADFGNVVVGQTSPALTFTVKNQSTTATAGGPSASLIGAPFQVAPGGTCTGIPLPPLGSCTINVVFKPTTLGPITSTMIVNASPGGTDTIDVSGTGVSATDLQLTPAPVAFGNVFAGTTKDITVIVTNPAGAQTSGALAFSVAGDATFTILNNSSPGDCVAGVTALPNGQTCNLRLRYAPVAFDDIGTHLNTGTLKVVATPGTPPAGVTAAVTGTAQSTLSISPKTFVYGTPPGTPLDVGTSQTQVFTVHNDSAAATVIGTAGLGSGSTGLAISADTCSGKNLLANASCTLSLTFTAPMPRITDTTTLVVPAVNTFGRAVAQITAKGKGKPFCAANCKFLIVHADCGTTPVTIQSQMLAQPGVALVDLIDAESAGSTPTLAKLLTYDEVVTFSDCPFNDATTLGNNLAAYVAANHPVVTLEFVDFSGAGNTPGGNWASLAPFTVNSSVQAQALSLGTFDASNALMTGVTAISGLYRMLIALTSGTTLVASWSSGVPLVAIKGNVVGINGYVGNVALTYAGDFAKVIVNAATQAFGP